MNEEKWKRFLQNEMDKEMQEIDGILEEMDNDPKMKDVVAPETMHDNLRKMIEENQPETEADRLSEEEMELIRLGKVYKKRRKWSKYLVLVAAVVCVLAIGVTSMGGPERVIEKVSWMIGDRDQTNVDSESDRVNEPDVVTEAEAYQQIEDEFGFYPVRLDYLPDGMEFRDIGLTDNVQNAYMGYAGKNQETIIYSIYPNYRTGSNGRDVEDEVIDEYERVVDDITIGVKKYLIEESQTTRHIINFEYHDVYYVLRLNNIVDEEVEKIIENLYFN